MCDAIGDVRIVPSLNLSFCRFRVPCRQATGADLRHASKPHVQQAALSTGAAADVWPAWRRAGTPSIDSCPISFLTQRLDVSI
eukprot:scaffold14721_cov120-Isochrysis_galbana.AAC.7